MNAAQTCHAQDLQMMQMIALFLVAFVAVQASAAVSTPRPSPAYALFRVLPLGGCKAKWNSQLALCEANRDILANPFRFRLRGGGKAMRAGKKTAESRASDIVESSRDCPDDPGLRRPAAAESGDEPGSGDGFDGDSRHLSSASSREGKRVHARVHRGAPSRLSRVQCLGALTITMRRAVRCVIFHVRNLMSGGRLAIRLRRLVWSAVASGQIKTVQAAYDQGVSVSFPLRAIGPHQSAKDALSKKTPLHLAASQGDSRMVRALIYMGANVDEEDHRGRSALHRGVDQGHLGVVGVLLKLRADVNKRARGQCLEAAIHLAVRRRYSASLRLLLKHGASVNMKTAFGETPLHIAAREGHLSMVRALLIAGADWSQRADNGWTAATCAQKAKHNQVYVYLCKVASGRISVKRMRRAETSFALYRDRRRARQKRR